MQLKVYTLNIFYDFKAWQKRTFQCVCAVYYYTKLQSNLVGARLDTGAGAGVKGAPPQDIFLCPTDFLKVKIKKRKEKKIKGEKGKKAKEKRRKDGEISNKKCIQRF